MAENLRLKDIQAGKTDAKNELIHQSREEQNLFCNSFVLPDNINIDAFERGDKYFILGLKGTGKTALLRYLDIKLQERGNHTSFVLFKSEFSDEAKAAFKQAANTLLADKNVEHFDGHDFTSVWELYFHRLIVELSEEKDLHIFNADKAWERYRDYINAGLPKKSSWSHLIPKMKRGNIELNSDFIKCHVDFEWDNKLCEQISLSKYVGRANLLFEKLCRGRDCLYILVDELELSYGNTKQYRTDTALIRDIIVAMNNLNSISNLNHFGIHIITAIRSEVLTSVNSLGKEINKPTHDFGVVLKWQQSGGSLEHHPLINIFVKRIQASEMALGRSQSSYTDVIANYLPERINDSEPTEYILRRTWFRPRDVIRILNLAQSLYGDETMLSQRVFDGINKEYSKECWVEQAEELSAKYRPEEIEGIRKLLMGIECPFTMGEINLIASRNRDYYREVDNLLSKHKLGDILSHLYDIGVIGNTGEKQMRFSFRGDQGLLIHLSMKLHDSLWNFFAAKGRSREN